MAYYKPAKRSSKNKKPAASNKPASKTSHKKKKSSGIGWLLLALILVALGIIAALQAKELYKEEILNGITIDDVDVSGMTKEQALEAVQEAAEERLENISIVFRYEDSTWNFNAEDLQASIDFETSVETAYDTGKEDSITDRYKTYREIASDGLEIKSTFNIDKQVLVEALADVKDEIDQPMIEPTIEFDPSDYDYFEDMDNPDVDMAKDMFTITEGSVGYDMDYDQAIEDLNEQLSESWAADVTLSVIESYPTMTVEELEECTTLVYHSSSYISTTTRTNTNRNHNIIKAISYYKGLVLMPGETVSYNELLGERTEANGWLAAPTIGSDKTLVDEMGGGICQAATTIFNAAFRAGATIIESSPHSWPAYFSDFGYAMDAMINYGTNDLIFTNTSDYPMFFNTYCWYDTYGRPGYVDVDVYTMPQKDEDGNILHIFAEYDEIRTEEPSAMVYEQIDEATAAEKFPDAEWTYDETLKMMVFEQVTPRSLREFTVDKVWYKDCIEDEESMGVWTEGVEVKREYSHTYLYKSITGKTYTMPTPTPAPTATPSPSPTESGDASG